jgi:hypothetical protein
MAIYNGHHKSLNVKKRVCILFSEWVKSVRSLIQIRIDKVNVSMIIRATSIFKIALKHLPSNLQ